MNWILALALSVSGLGLLLSVLVLTTIITQEKYEGLSAYTVTIVFWAGIGILNFFSVLLIILNSLVGVG